MNGLKTTLLLGALTGFLLFIGDRVGGQSGLIFALVLAGVMNLGAYFYSDKIALKMSGAQPVSREQAPRLYGVVERLAAKANLPAPRIYLIPTDSPNAFATGRNPKHSAVAVTRGLLNVLGDEEVEGVLAHELAHIKNRDILISCVAATIAGAIAMLARMVYYAELFGLGGRGGSRGGGMFSALAMMIVAPLIAMIIQMGISRSREYAADATAAEITGNPYGLARALQKIEAYAKRLPLETSPAMSHMYIIKPFSAGQVFANLFSTHPPTARRIERLIGRATV
jgi:heat shock protein HtpX